MGKPPAKPAKNVPDSLRWLIQPALFASLGLHVLLLLLPLPDRSIPEPVALEADTQVRVTPLPAPRTTPTASAPPSPTPSPSPQPSVLPTPMPRQAVVQRPAVVARPPTPQPPALPPIQSPPASPSPSPAPLATLALPSPDPVPLPALPFADVPVLAGAETGCYGLGTCHRLVGGMDFRTAGRTLEEQLKAQGYTVRFRDDIEAAGSKTYEITKDGETRYLNVLSAGLNDAVYLVTPQPISLADLQNSDLPRAELEGVLNGLPATTANATQFAEPEAFFTGALPRSETGGELRLVVSPPDQVLPMLTGQLQSQGFTLIEAGGYGSGLLYEVTKGALTAYLNLVPTSDRSGTVVVLWSNLPESGG